MLFFVFLFTIFFTIPVIDIAIDKYGPIHPMLHRAVKAVAQHQLPRTCSAILLPPPSAHRSLDSHHTRALSNPMNREQHTRRLNRAHSPVPRNCSMRCRSRQYSDYRTFSNPMNWEQHSFRINILRNCGIPRGRCHRCRGSFQFDLPLAFF